MSKFVSIISVQTKCHQLVKKYEQELKQIDIVVGMSRGGLIPAALIATEINKPLVSIYINKQDEYFLDRAEWLKDKNVLFVDDVCRSGTTMFGAVLYLKSHAEAKEIKVLTMFEIESIQKKAHPQFTHKSKEDVCFPWDYDKK